MNDFMEHEVLRQAAEGGDPAAQTTSWSLPTSGATRRIDAMLFAALGAAVLVAVAAVLFLSRIG